MTVTENKTPSRVEQNIKTTSASRGGVRHKIKVFSRKISTMETKDINPDILKRIGAFFVAFLIVSYSIQIFVHLFSLLYPAIQTTKAIQVFKKTFPLPCKTRFVILDYRVKSIVGNVAGSGTGSCSASCLCQSRCFSSSRGCSPSTPSSRLSFCSGAWPRFSQMELTQCSI